MCIRDSFGVVLTAGYILWMAQRTMFGPTIDRFSNVRDASRMEMVPLAVLIGAIILVGIYPSVISDMFRDGVAGIVADIQRSGALAMVLP